MLNRGNILAIVLLLVVLVSFAPACATGVRVTAAANANEICGYWCAGLSESAYCECARGCLDALEPEATQ